MIPETEIAKMKERVEKAHKMVSALCVAEQRWVMSVPARPDADPDIVISDGLRVADELLSKIEEQSRELVRLREGESCVVCGASLMPLSDEPPHCQDCSLSDDHFTSQEVFEGIPELVSKAEEMEKQGVPVVDVPKVGE